MLFEIAKRHGLELEEEAEYGNRKYLEKQDFILCPSKRSSLPPSRVSWTS